jgi:hypothetical protein
MQTANPASHLPASVARRNGPVNHIVPHIMRICLTVTALHILGLKFANPRKMRPLRCLPWALIVLLTLVSLSPSRVSADISTEFGVNSAFFPEFDDTDLRIQFKVLRWWDMVNDTAIVRKGTLVPRVTTECKESPDTCQNWKVPGDIKVKLTTPKAPDVHRLGRWWEGVRMQAASNYFAPPPPPPPQNLPFPLPAVFYLTYSGTRVPIYQKPYEVVRTGCSGAAAAVCCGDREYVLQRDQVFHKVYQPWSVRPNGTYPADGSSPNNFKRMGLRADVVSGYYSASAEWPNFFENLEGQTSDRHLSLAAGVRFADASGASFVDRAAAVSSHLLFLPDVPDVSRAQGAFVRTWVHACMGVL